MLTAKVKIYLTLGKYLIVLILLGTCVGYHLHARSLSADNDRLKQVADIAEQARISAIDAHQRDRAMWEEVGQAVAAAAAAQGDICRANAERQAQIDEVSQKTKVAAKRPKGIIDDQSSKKVIYLLNNIFNPYAGGGLRQAPKPN